jgi:hypothetical protein
MRAAYESVAGDTTSSKSVSMAKIWQLLQVHKLLLIMMLM